MRWALFLEVGAVHGGLLFWVPPCYPPPEEVACLFTSYCMTTPSAIGDGMMIAGELEPLSRSSPAVPSPDLIKSSVPKRLSLSYAHVGVMFFQSLSLTVRVADLEVDDPYSGWLALYILTVAV